MNYETVIGLEVHVELKTESKMFSPSPAHFGAEPNTNTNVIDWGYPGVLPVINKGAVEFCMKAALALKSLLKHTSTAKTTSIRTIRKRTKFRNWITRSAMTAGLKSKWKALRKRSASSASILKKMPAKICTDRTAILMST